MDVTKRDILRRTIKDALTDLSHTHPDLVELFQAFLDLEEEAWKPPMWIVSNPTSPPPHPLFPNPLLPPYPIGGVWPSQSHSYGSTNQQEFSWTTGYDSGNPSTVMLTATTASSPIPPPTLIPYDTVPEISEEEPAAPDDDHDDDAGEMISQ